MSSLSLDTQNEAERGPVTSMSASIGSVSSATPMFGRMPPPPITCDDAADVEPIVPRCDVT